MPRCGDEERKKNKMKTGCLAFTQDTTKYLRC